MSRKPPPGMVAAAEQDYHAMRDRVSLVLRGARLLALAQSEVEAFAEVYYVLSRSDPRIAAMGAAAIMQLAMRPGTAQDDG